MNELLCAFLTVYFFVLMARLLLSWFPIQPGSPIASIHRLLYEVTEPVLAPLRGLIPPIRTGAMAFDLSPIVAIFAIRILQGIVC